MNTEGLAIDHRGEEGQKLRAVTITTGDVLTKRFARER
jgi:hypothetical protein